MLCNLLYTNKSIILCYRREESTNLPVNLLRLISAGKGFEIYIIVIPIRNL
jgi:hypothetical protein